MPLMHGFRPLQIAGRDSFWPTAAVLFPVCAVVVQPGVWWHAAATASHFPKGCVEMISPARDVLRAASGVIFGMDDSR